MRHERGFAFTIGLSAADDDLLTRVQMLLRCGYLVRSARRQAHFDDETAFVVKKLHDLVHVIVPFMDEHLPPSYKREQYLAWRAELLDYWEHRAKRVRPCTVEGCDQPRRAKGVCRHHLYVLYRQ